MRQMVLHFGMPKTGSSSIQNTLYRANLGPDWEYAKLGGPNHSSPIQFAFFRDLSRFGPLFRFPVRSDRARLKLKDEQRTRFVSALESCTSENLIVSAEVLKRLAPDELNDFNETCLASGFRVRAVGYLRNPKSSIESIFQQRYKTGHSPNLKRLQSVYPRYEKSLGQFEEVFGKGNVSYWLYETETLTEKCVVKDFLFRLGIKPEQVVFVRINESLSLPGFRFLYTYRRFGPEQPSRHVMLGRVKLFETLGSLKGPKLSFSKELIDPIIEKNREDIGWANRKLGTPFLSPRDADGSPGCVNSETDLLNYDPESIRWLADSINKSYTDYTGDPVQVAKWMHTLHQRLVFQRIIDSRRLSKKRGKGDPLALNSGDDDNQ